jgi:ketosteroid isomerase-like protein
MLYFTPRSGAVSTRSGAANLFVGDVMKRTLTSGVLITALSLTFGCASQTKAPDTAAMVAKASALDQAFLEAMNRGDVDALASMYWDSPEVVMFPPDTLESRGYSAVRDGFAKMFATMKNVKMEVTDSREIPAGDVVIGYGLFHMTGSAPDGSPIDMTGRFTDVKAERDGKWVYLIDHASVPLPPMPAAPPKARRK